jgi:hypothetical protein
MNGKYLDLKEKSPHTYSQRKVPRFPTLILYSLVPFHTTVLSNPEAFGNVTSMVKIFQKRMREKIAEMNSQRARRKQTESIRNEQKQNYFIIKS